MALETLRHRFGGDLRKLGGVRPFQSPFAELGNGLLLDRAAAENRDEPLHAAAKSGHHRREDREGPHHEQPADRALLHTGHDGRAHGNWVGMLARLAFDDRALVEVAFSMVRHNERNETYVCDLLQDKEAVEQITRRCDKLGTTLTISGSEMIVK